MSRRRCLVLLVAFCLVSFACSFSDSSQSISDSISSPFKSSSGSSGGENSAYLRDVEALAYAFAGSGGEAEGFLRELGSVAERHGIADWEAGEHCYVAIGAGFRRAGLSRDETRALAGRLFGEESPALPSVLRGYTG